MEQKKAESSQVEKKYSVPAIVNAFEILKVLSRKKFRESTLTEIAQAVQLTPATCYRVLQQLKELSLVRFDNNKKRYTLGTYLVVLGERAKENLDFINVIDPYLAELTRDTNLTSLLVSRVDDLRLTQLSKNEDDNSGVRISIGRHFNLLDGESYGNCFLAFMEADERNALLADQSEEERDKLLEQLSDYQARGYSWNYFQGSDSKYPGIFGVSAPIYLEDDRTELCISVVGLTAQYTEEDVLETIAPKVKEIAKQINQEFNDALY